MFSIEYLTPCNPRGTIRTKSPVTRIGFFEDVDGIRWDARAIVYKGKEHNYVSAVPVNELHPYFSSTGNEAYGMISQNWYPYKIEIVE
jgi:hypothetical protein